MTEVHARGGAVMQDSDSVTRPMSGDLLGGPAEGSLRSSLKRQALTIVGLYAAAAGAWIGLSDPLLAALVGDAERFVRLSLVKGLVFVLGTAGLLYLLLRRTFGAIDRAFAAVKRKETERVTHERHRLRMEAIVESTNDAIVSRTTDGVITSWNPAAERLFGYSAEEIIGEPVTRLLPSDGVDEEAALSSRVIGGERLNHVETVRVRKDGSQIPVAITFSPMRVPGSQKINGTSEIIRDISERKRAEEIAARERRFAGTLMEAMPGIFYLYDESGRFLRWNKNFERVSGYSAEEVAAMHPLDFFRGDDRERVSARIADVFDRGESSVEAEFVARDGTATPYFFTGRRVVLDGATCLVGVGVDITKRKTAEAELRRSEERYRTTLDSMLEGCQIVDFDWRYLYVNEAAALQNQRPSSDFIGKRVHEIWPGIENTEPFAAVKAAMQERRPFQGERKFRFPDGRTAWLDIRAQPVPEGIAMFSVDTTERRRAEKALHEANDQLELRIAERTRELDAAKERAEAADRLKSAFLATMSHELRTPLNSIIGFTGIIAQGLAGPLTAEQKKQLGMVQNSARHLLSLINDVLDISKIEAGQLEIRRARFDLRAAVGRVADSVVPQAEKKGLTLDVRMPEAATWIVSDQRRLEQILLNLLSNAIKFTDRGGVTLTLETDPAKAEARFAVADTGIGIRAEELGLLFQPFRQIDTGLQRQHEGSGLGLAISRRLTELLGGSIHAESTWGSGSVFTVSVPLERENES